MDYLLPSSVYQSPPRLGRGRKLNTIIEDNEESTCGVSSDSEGTMSDRTIVGRPIDLDAKLAIAASRTRPQFRPASPVSVVSSVDEDENCSNSSRSSYAGSDAGTIFSESCPSLTGSNLSDTTTFATASNRSSVASRSSRNKYPALMIPRGSWGSIEGNVKEVAFGMSPSTKILLSPEILRSIPHYAAELEDAPSLADTHSIRSESPCLPAMRSAPATPDMHNLEISEGQPWGGHGGIPETPLEIAIDEHHSILLSPAEAHSSRYTHSRAQSDAWSEIMGHFPRIPGATPQEMTPVTPDIPRNESFNNFSSETGIQLPAAALDVLRNLTRIQTPVSESESSYEMKEVGFLRRPKSIGQTPISEYSFSNLSIPSPGGFFSSLQAGARHTWAPPARDPTPPPSSAAAENFYNMPWSAKETIVQTVVFAPEVDDVDGPPTARQPVFNLNADSPTETPDLYGGNSSRTTAAPSQEPLLPTSFEYEEAYEEGIKQAAEINIDRTGTWLSAQSTYLSALRETNPLNDPADHPLATIPVGVEPETDAQQAVRFLEAANKAAVTPANDKSSGSPSTSPTKEPMFLEAFLFSRSEARCQDTFLQASARLQSIQTTRIALPKLHTKSLLNDHSARSLTPQHSRPKYRGPFSQNPRATGVFDHTAEQECFANLERQQLALAAILPTSWTVEAQSKILYNDRLLACSVAHERLTRKSNTTAAKGIRVLDLGGSATASWAWAAATKWTNAKIITVQSEAQAQLRSSTGGDDQESAIKPLNPSNHHVTVVPQLWQLPFKSAYFDVISARTLHMYLKSNPIPGVSSIDEWDLTLKECMRVLKPGGILDYFVMDSGVNGMGAPMTDAVDLSPNAMTSSNASTTTLVEPTKRKADATRAEFSSELTRRSYEVDGGCGRLMARLKKEGFVGVKRQYIGLPMGQAAEEAEHYRAQHSRNTSDASAKSATILNRRGDSSYSYTSHFNADGSSKRPFRMAPRPISEVSTVQRIVDQYLNCEAVQGPVGSTQDVADMSSLLGELLWEEWLVRLRIEAGVAEDMLLDGVNDVFEEWRRSGRAAWKGVVGWARKPNKKESKEIEIKEWKEQGRVPSPVERIRVGLEVDFVEPTQQEYSEVEQYSSQPEMSSKRNTVIEELRIDTTGGSWMDYHVRGQQMPQTAKLSPFSPMQYDYELSVQQLGSQGRHQMSSVRAQNTSGLKRNESVFSQREFSQSAIERGDVAEIPFMLMG